MAEKQLTKSLNLLAKTSIFVLAGVFLSKLFAYAYRIIIARHYGAEVYGLFSLGIMVLGLTVIFATLGLTQGLSRFTAYYRGKKEYFKLKKITKEVVVFTFVFSLIATAILFYLSTFISITIFHDERLIIYLKLFSLAVPITVMMNVSLSILSGFEKISIYSFIYNFFQNFVKVLFLIGFILFGINYLSIIYSHIIAIFLSLSIAGFFVVRIFKSHEFQERKGSKAIFGEVFSYSWPLMFFGFVEGLLSWTDSFMIGYFKTAADVGLYNAAVPLALAFGLTADIFMQLFHPLINREYGRKNIKLIRELSKQVVKWIFILNLPFLILTLVFPGVILHILFGGEFTAAENALRILSLGTFFSSISIVSNRIITMKGKSKLLLKNVLVAAVANIILNFFLVKKYGINGAAISTTLCLIGFGLVCIYQAYKELGVFPVRRKMITVFIVSLVPMFLLILFRSFVEETNILNMAILVIFFFLLYFALVLIFGGFDRNDREVIEYVRSGVFGKINKMHK